jgi:hypothetical protein
MEETARSNWKERLLTFAVVRRHSESPGNPQSGDPISQQRFEHATFKIERMRANHLIFFTKPYEHK